VANQISKRIYDITCLLNYVLHVSAVAQGYYLILDGNKMLLSVLAM